MGAFIQRTTTELAVTSRRVLAKFGLISRKTIELNHTQVESCNLEQSVLGRLLGYGNLTFVGTGGATNEIKYIDRPLRFRNIAMEAVDKTKSAQRQ